MGRYKHKKIRWTGREGMGVCTFGGPDWTPEGGTEPPWEVLVRCVDPAEPERFIDLYLTPREATLLGRDLLAEAPRCEKAARDGKK